MNLYLDPDSFFPFLLPPSVWEIVMPPPTKGGKGEKTESARVAKKCGNMHDRATHLTALYATFCVTQTGSFFKKNNLFKKFNVRETED